MNRLKVLDRNALKVIAIIAMVMDHIAPIVFESNSLWWNIFRIIGRLTFTIMIYFLAEGFRYTRNLKKYILRMFIFSIISLFTFSFLETGSWLPIQILSGNIENYAFTHYYIETIDKTICISEFSIITNFLLALLALTIWEKTKWKKPFKVLVTAIFLLISMNCDWQYLPICLAFNFYYFREKKCIKWCIYTLFSLLYVFNICFPNNLFDVGECLNATFRLYRVGMVLLPIMIEIFYNGLAGKKSVFGKWFFYVFYPAHQVAIGFLAMLINK